MEGPPALLRRALARAFGRSIASVGYALVSAMVMLALAFFSRGGGKGLIMLWWASCYGLVGWSFMPLLQAQRTGVIVFTLLWLALGAMAGTLAYYSGSGEHIAIYLFASIAVFAWGFAEKSSANARGDG